MDTSTHPVRKWIDDGAVTDAQFISKLRKALGKGCSADYIEDVVSGYYPPSRKLAKAMSKVTGIGAGVILEFPYRAKRAA